MADVDGRAGCVVVDLRGVRCVALVHSRAEPILIVEFNRGRAGFCLTECLCKEYE